MLKDLLDYGKQILTLTRDTQQSKEAIKELQQGRKEDRQEIKNLSEKVDRLTEIVQRLAFELQRQNDKSDAERRMLLLEVENMILRSGRVLPPSNRPDDQL